MKPFTKIDFQIRIEKVCRKLQTALVDGLIIEDPINLYYLTGLHLSTGRLLVENRGATLFVDGRYAQIAKESAPCPVFSERDLDVGLLLHIKEEKSIRKIGYLSDQVVAYKLFRWEELAKKHDLQKTQFIPLPHLMSRIRELKGALEVAKIKAACDLTNTGFSFLQSHLHEGVTEIELSKKLEIFWIEQGGERLAFDPIIAFGENSAKPHHLPTDRPLQKGDLVQFDLGVVKWDYHADMSRVIFFAEKNPKLEEIEKIVFYAQKKAISLCKPGTPIGELDRQARSIIEKAGYGEYFVHSLGHGVGLEIHEYPIIKRDVDEKEVLKEGMVITIEPGIYLSGVGGVRIEDTILITHDGYQILTKEEGDV